MNYVLLVCIMDSVDDNGANFQQLPVVAMADSASIASDSQR